MSFKIFSGHRHIEEIEYLEDLMHSDFRQAALCYIFNENKKAKEFLILRLKHAWKLAKLLGTQPPDQSVGPVDFFSGRDWHRRLLRPVSRRPEKPDRGPRDSGPGMNPDQPAPVPRKPLPNPVAGTIALAITRGEASIDQDQP